MWSLAIESSTQVASVALLENSEVRFQKESRIQKSHSEHLNQFVADLLEASHLKLQDIKFISVGIGPGSFTGIRVSVNIAKTLSYGCNIPLVAVNSLEALAAPYADQNIPVVALINAYKNMCYYAVFKGGVDKKNIVREAHVIPVKEMKKIIDSECLAVGDGYLFYEKFLPFDLKSRLKRPSAPVDFPSASTMGRIGFSRFHEGLTFDWKSLNPLYIRSSEAEETAQGIVWSPLDFKE